MNQQDAQIDPLSPDSSRTPASNITMWTRDWQKDHNSLHLLRAMPLPMHHCHQHDSALSSADVSMSTLYISGTCVSNYFSQRQSAC